MSAKYTLKQKLLGNYEIMSYKLKLKIKMNAKKYFNSITKICNKVC